MGRELYYKPGSFYRVCDMTGFTVRAGRTKKQWNNIIVRDQSFELRQPQDFVRGVRDDQNVPEARPRPTPTVLGVQTTLALGWVPGDPPNLTVVSTAGFSMGDGVSVLLDTQDVFTAKIASIDFTNSVLTISPNLPSSSMPGNYVANDSSIAGVSQNSYPSSGGGGA